MTYDFDEKLLEGKQYEKVLDAVFVKGFEIVDASEDDQRRGIDRWYTSRGSGERFAVEYKSDKTAGRTHNAFIETISVDPPGKPGWAFTSQAKYLLYFIPDDRLIYVIKFTKLRRRLERWQQEYQTKRIPNKGYDTVGLIVPLEEIEACSSAQASI